MRAKLLAAFFWPLRATHRSLAMGSAQRAPTRAARPGRATRRAAAEPSRRERNAAARIYGCAGDRMPLPIAGEAP
jgi:hypothetical protein